MPSLQSLWKEGREGALSPLEQMRAWALREAQKDLGGEEAVNHQKIADRVTKVGGGHPSREAIRKFLDRVDEDSDWYPGKNYRKRSGPQPVLQGNKRRQVAKSGTVFGARAPGTMLPEGSAREAVQNPHPPPYILLYRA